MMKWKKRNNKKGKPVSASDVYLCAIFLISSILELDNIFILCCMHCIYCAFVPDIIVNN
jgi:hypothetical protein